MSFDLDQFFCPFQSSKHQVRWADETMANNRMVVARFPYTNTEKDHLLLMNEKMIHAQ